MEIDLGPDMAVIEALKLVVQARKMLRAAQENYLAGQVDSLESALRDQLIRRLGQQAMCKALEKKE